MKFQRSPMILKLSTVLLVGIVVAACANTMEGVGKDLQKMGTSMESKPATNSSASTQTQGKDVTVTPVK